MENQHSQKLGNFQAPLPPSEDEARMMQESLAHENFGMTLDEFIEA